MITSVLQMRVTLEPPTYIYGARSKTDVYEIKEGRSDSRLQRFLILSVDRSRAPTH